MHQLQPNLLSENKLGITMSQHDKTNKMTYAPSDDSEQPGHPSSLIRVFAVCSVGS